MELATVFSLLVALTFCMCVTYGHKPRACKGRGCSRGRGHAYAWGRGSRGRGDSTVEQAMADPAPAPTSDPPETTEPATTAEPNICVGDATTLCSCPGGFTLCANRCYHADATWYNYTEAEQYCSSMSAILAVPRSPEEQQCVWDVAAAAADVNYFWLGYRDKKSAFVGADGGGYMSFTNWNTSGEPDLDFTGNCVYLYSSDGLWGHRKCQNTQYVLCQAHN